MLENHALFLSVFACIGGVVVASWELAPQLNDLIQLAPFPDDVYRYKVRCVAHMCMYIQMPLVHVRMQMLCMHVFLQMPLFTETGAVPVQPCLGTR